MKLIVRTPVIGICAVGASAAVISSHAVKDSTMVNRQAGVSASPIPN